MTRADVALRPHDGRHQRPITAYHGAARLAKRLPYLTFVLGMLIGLTWVTAEWSLLVLGFMVVTLALCVWAILIHLR